MTDVLTTIVAHKRTEIATAKERVLPDELRRQAENVAATGPKRDFFAALNKPGEIRLIAEVKKASPSAGLIRADFDPVAIAATYIRHGAACVSVLTDEHFFQGHLDYLEKIRHNVTVPLLRKDFILDEYQLWEAKVAGADAVLLIAECLDDCNLRKLYNAAIDLGLCPLVEFYEPANLDRVLEAGATLIGVNNRNLATFETDLEHTLRVRELIPTDCLLVSESGIRTHADVQRLQSAGVNAILVGESLMRQEDVGRAVDELLGPK